MATIIDALLVTMGLDSSGVKKGAEEVEQHVDKAKDKVVKAGREISDSGKEMAEFFNKLKVEVMSIIAVFTGGMALKQFSENTITSTANLGRLSENLNMSAKELLQWELANKQAGGSQEGMVAQLKESAEEMEKVKRGEQSSAMTWIAAFGGNVSGLKNGNDLLMERSRIIKKIWDSGDHTRAKSVATLMGINDDSFNLIMKGPEAILELVRAQEKHANVTKKNIEDAQAFERAIKGLEDSATDAGRGVLFQFLPDMQNGLDKLVKWIDEHQGDIRKWVDGAIEKVKEFIKVADDAAKSVGGWENVLIALVSVKVGAGLISLASNLANIAASLAAISKLGGGALLGLLKNPVKYSGAGAVLGVLLNPDDLGKDEDLQKRFGTSTGQLPLVKSHGDAPLGRAEKLAFLKKLEKMRGLPEGIMEAIWWKESSFGKNMISPKGALGDFQIMPENIKKLGVKDPMNFYDSAEGAAKLLEEAKKKHGNNVADLLAVYNEGEPNFQKYGVNGLPETRNYAREVQGYMQSHSTNSNNEVHIGQVTIMTQATDGKEAAQGFQDFMKDSGWISAQANTAY